MSLWKNLVYLLGIKNDNSNKRKDIEKQIVREKTARHEAAHGIIWFLFRNNWNVKQLTIERDNLPDKSMDGALQISPNFENHTQPHMERANEIFAIALAGMIGQNIKMIDDNPNFVLISQNYANIFDMFDISGCGGDFEILKKYLPLLSFSFNSKESTFIRFKIFDLVSLFQDRPLVRILHNDLTVLLLKKGTLLNDEITTFFESRNFQEYINEEDLGSNFYHQHL